MKRAVVCVMTVVAFLTFTVLAVADQKSQPQKTSNPTPQKSTQPSPAPASQRSSQPVQPSTGTVSRDITKTPTGQALKDLSSGAKTPGQTYDGSRGPTTAPAVSASTTTARTPQQAIDQYKASGPQNPGPQTLKIKEPPSPVPTK